jgi:argininosuccinate synthase
MSRDDDGEQLMDIDEVRRHRVGVLMSGGLSCTAVGAWLAENGVDTVGFVADIGQDVPLPAAGLAEALVDRGLPTRVVDLRAAMADFYLDILRYQAAYEGGYWNTTSGSRAVLVEGLAEPLRAAGCTVLVHGCVGGGNDQGRFARYAAASAPDLTVFTPWTEAWLLERFPDRQSMTDYLTSRGYPAAFAGFTAYSIDGNLGGYSHDGDELESLTTSARVIAPLMTRWPHDAPDETERVEVRFVAGRPVAVNGVPVSPLSAVRLANEIGARNGVSMHSLVENRVNGTKCRGVYEAPGLDLLGQCLAALYQVTLDKSATDLLHVLSRLIGRAVYEGQFHDTATRAARAAADLLSANANGTVSAALYKGGVLIEELRADDGAPGVRHQTRFRYGGHHWHTEFQPA